MEHQLRNFTNLNMVKGIKLNHKIVGFLLNFHLLLVYHIFHNMLLCLFIDYSGLLLHSFVITITV